MCISTDKRGFFITFEGGEGSGKSTQIKLLTERFRLSGHSVVATREPGGTELAEKIRTIVLESVKKDVMIEALLFSAARRDHCINKIKPALDAGDIVVCDRFTDSSRAYQGVELGSEHLDVILNIASCGLVPDITFLFDILPEIGLERANKRRPTNAGFKDRFESVELEFHKRVRENYLAISRSEPQRFHCLSVEDKKENEILEEICIVLRNRFDFSHL